MTKKVRNRARPTSTWLGGVCWMPSAVRRNDSTTMIRVNEVTMTRIDGARLRTVSSARSWMMRPVVVPAAVGQIERQALRRRRLNAQHGESDQRQPA